MEQIKSLVEQLKPLTDKNNIVSKLQKINECFLQNYMINIYGLKIYPVEIEIYYYKKHIFEDEICHRHDLQKDEQHFGKLYFHRCGRSRKKEANIDISNRGGFDICIFQQSKQEENKEYYLSILIRGAYIKGKLYYMNKILQYIIKSNKNYSNDCNENRVYLEGLEKKQESVLEKKDKNITCENYILQPRINNGKYFKKEDYGEYAEYRLNTLMNKEEIYKDILDMKNKDSISEPIRRHYKSKEFKLYKNLIYCS